MDPELERMLNNITNDLDILLSEFCHLPYSEPGEPPPCHNNNYTDTRDPQAYHRDPQAYNRDPQTLHRDTQAYQRDTQKYSRDTQSCQNKPLRSFHKKPMQIENCSAFGGSSTSGTLTSTDSNHSNKDVRSGTLTSTDSNNSGITKPHSLSIHSTHLDGLGYSPSRALDVPVYPEKQSSPSRSTSGSDLRQITVLERLSTTHPIWCLTKLGRSGAVHFLKDRETGTFIVRKSSQQDGAMALSVQFPDKDGHHNVDHYLILSTEAGLHLQGSLRLFTAIPDLIAHYCDNKEDLPYRLVLPSTIQQVKTSKELTALAMLGQDFWTSKYEGQSRSSSRTNLSEHSSGMNKSISEPISINKIQVPAYSQSETLIQNSPPKHSVIDFKSYLIKPTTKESTEFSTKTSSQSVSNIIQSVQSSCSVSENKQCSHVTTENNMSSASHMMSQSHMTSQSHVTSQSSYLHEEESSRVEMRLQSNNFEMTNRDSQVSVPYAIPNKKRNNLTTEPEPSHSTDYLEVPGDVYFTSNLSDKLSDYEDIWKNNYQDPNYGSVQTDILQRLQPNLINPYNNNMPCFKESSSSFSHENTSYKEQCFSEMCVTKDLNVSLDKLPVSKETVSIKEMNSSSSQHTVSSQLVNSNNVLTSNHSESTHESYATESESTVLHNSVHCDIKEDLNKVLVRESLHGFETIPEHESDLDTDSCHSNSCLSDEDGEADTEDGEVIPRINSVQTQTSPAWKKKIPPPLTANGGTRKSVSTSSLCNLKSPVYSEPFDAISRAERKNGHVPKLPKKMRRKSAPALSLAKRRLGSFECQRLSPLLSSKFEGDQSRVEHCETNGLPSSGAENGNSTENEEVFEMSGEHKFNNLSAMEKHVVNGHEYEKAWMVKQSETTSTVIKTSDKPPIKPSPTPRKTKSKPPRTIHEVAMKNRKSLNEEANRLKQKNIQNDSLRPNSAFVADQFSFLEDFDINSNPSSPTLNKFPVYNRQVSADSRITCSESSTAEEMICTWNPELTLKPVKPFNTVFTDKPGAMSEYDNLNNMSYMALSGQSVASNGTVFNQPWESSVVGKIMKTHHHPIVSAHSPHIPVNSPPPSVAPPSLPLPPPMDTHQRIKEWQLKNIKYNKELDQERRLSFTSADVTSVDAVTFGGELSSTYEFRVSSNEQKSQSQSDKTIVNSKSMTTHSSGAVVYRTSDNIPLFGADFREKVAPILAYPRLLQKPERSRHPDNKIREYILGLSKNEETTFGTTIANFIQCTQDGADHNPFNVTRNIRQFMNGIKNYLVKHGEGELEDLIDRERNMLGADEILNIDAILEGALHECVIQPLTQNIYKLFVNEYTRNGNLELLYSNILFARTKSPEDIGIRKGLSPPDVATMEVIKGHLSKMMKSYSPLKKLESLLGATSSIYKCVASKQKGNISPTFGADDFLPMLIYVLVQCGMVSVEIEADYMWGLLHPSLLTGEGGYYLTSLSSAVLVLKNFRQMHETKAIQHEPGKLPSISDMQGFLRIAIPDEQRDTIQWKTLPVRPSMTTRDVCSMIAHKFKVTNPQDYGLYTLENGEECKLLDMECPQRLKADRQDHHKECIFTYKRHAANIAWPKTVK